MLVDVPQYEANRLAKRQDMLDRARAGTLMDVTVEEVLAYHDTHRKVRPGVYVSHLNAEHDLPGRLPFEASYPTFHADASGSLADALGYHDGFHCYGVVDSPEQFLRKAEELLEKDPRKFVVFLTHMPKEPENKGKGGGWRWHKWGPYIGEGNPEYEYLDDETGFEDGVYVYHVFDVGSLMDLPVAETPPEDVELFTSLEAIDLVARK